MQLATWNVHGKSICQTAAALADQQISFDALALQEVGALPEGIDADPSLLIDAADLPIAARDDLANYWILGTNNLQSHLGQALLFDKTLFPAILQVHKGQRSLGAKLALRSGGFLWILGVHFPHHQNDMDVYAAATREIHSFAAKVQGTPFLIAGDWNSQPDGPNMDQQALEIACLAAEDLLHIAMPAGPTWQRKTYDFFLCSQHLHSKLSPATAQPYTVPHMRDLLPSDHHLVAWDLVWEKGSKRKRTSHFHTAKWTINSEALAAAIQSAAPARTAWDELCRLAHCSQRRALSKKYVDPPALKQLCQLRNNTFDTTLRASLSRQILHQRREAKQQWALDLQNDAAMGDDASIAFLKARRRKASNWTTLIDTCGSREAAADAVRTHFAQVFSATPAKQRDQECSQSLHTLSAHMGATKPLPIASPELHTALLKLHRGKTSGASGMSNEFLLAAAQHTEGEHLLLQALNDMFLQGNFHPDLTRGVACLIPKIQQAKTANDIRPILLLEVLQKVFCRILMTRLQPLWCPLFAQLGAVPGGQAIEALFAAHSMMSIAKVMHKHYLFIKMDLKGAFDNLKHASVAQFLASLPPSAAWEAKRLLQLLLSQTLDFQFLQEEWQLRSTAGTPQGGSHSAGLFARTLDYFLANLVTKWERLGYRAPFDPLWLLLYVDDIMLCFKNWRQACALMPSFLDMLNSIGMKVNFSKSCVIVDAVLLRAAATECTSPLLREFQWSETTSYLNRPFGYQVSVETLCQQVAQKVHAAWGSLRGILGRRWWTNPSQTDTLLTKHVGSVFLWLSPVLYPYSAVLNSIQTLQTTVFADALGLFIPDLSYDTAVQLVRLRRHVVKRWLLHVAPAGNWCAKLLRRLWTFTGHICRQTSHPSQPARVMMGLFAATHAHGLARPGPWKTLHALFHKFWTSHELEGDFLNTALDRESWKTLEPAFVQWFQPSTRCTWSFCNAVRGNRRTCFYEHTSHGYTQLLFN